MCKQVFNGGIPSSLAQLNQQAETNKAAYALRAGVQSCWQKELCSRDCGFIESIGTLIRMGRFTRSAQRASFLPYADASSLHGCQGCVALAV